MQKKMKTKLFSLILTASLILGTIFSPVQPMPKVQAAKKAYMKTLSLNWDLRKNKNLALTAYCPGIGRQKYNVKMTTYKLTNANKKGYKKLTIGFKVTRKWKLTKKKVDKILRTCYEKLEMDHMYLPFVSAYSVADYKTGTSLEGKNDYDVKVKSLKSKFGKSKKVNGSKGNWIKFPKAYAARFEITYPKDYTGLCIGLLGSNDKTGYDSFFTAIYEDDVTTDYCQDYIDDEYFEGTKFTKVKKDEYKHDNNGTPFKFGQTTYYRMGKKNSHWLHVK